MRYRALDANGDYSFGHGNADFLVDSPDAVAQLVLTRLRLWTNEWFLDVTDGTPYLTEVVGTGTKPLYDQVIKNRILGTEGVAGIVSYSSVFDSETRGLAIQATINTQFGGAAPFGATVAIPAIGPTFSITSDTGLLGLTSDTNLQVVTD